MLDFPGLGIFSKEFKMSEILITGAKGQLGTELCHLLDERNIAYDAFDSSELDITNELAVEKKRLRNINQKWYIIVQLIQQLIMLKIMAKRRTGSLM